MCLLAKPNAVIHTAKKDIHVYKFLTYRHGRYLSPFKHYIYPKNKLCDIAEDKQELKLKRSPLGDSSTVYEGFHAYRSLESAEGNPMYIRIGKFTIPKGAKYILSSNGHEIVSDKIIFNYDIDYKEGR